MPTAPNTPEASPLKPKTKAPAVPGTPKKSRLNPKVKLPAASRRAQTAKSVERFQSHFEGYTGCLRILIVIAVSSLLCLFFGRLGLLALVLLMIKTDSFNNILKKKAKKDPEPAVDETGEDLAEPDNTDDTTDAAEPQDAEETLEEKKD